MSKPSSVVATSAARQLAAPTSQIGAFEYADRKIFPVETSAFKTVNFNDPENANAVLYSGDVSACAIVLITDPDSKITTMAHFYPTNGVSTKIALQNLNAAFDDFARCGGTLSKKTTVQTFGGAVLPGEDIRDTTPLGALLDAIDAKFSTSSKKEKFRIIRHQRDSITTGFGEGITVAVNKDGIAVAKINPARELSLISEPLESLPLGLLSDLKPNPYYPEAVNNFMLRRGNIISGREAGKELAIQSMDAQFTLCETMLSRAASSYTSGR